jgi:hypothetical protein
VSFEISNTPSKSAPAGVEDGLAPAKFLYINKQNHPDWAKENGPFGADNGDRLHWGFVLTDENYEELYGEDGDPIELDVANSANFNTKSDKSKNAQWMKAVSPKAFAAIDAGEPVDPSTLEGARVLLLLEMKDNGWPKIKNVLPAQKSRRVAAPVASIVDEEE